MGLADTRNDDEHLHEIPLCPAIGVQSTRGPGRCWDQGRADLRNPIVSVEAVLVKKAHDKKSCVSICRGRLQMGRGARVIFRRAILREN